ncbi:MAG: hypothetical protein OXB88_07225 [Bacteriovoracales bacterium]|nr:hypothetical protein [Bacteriovoracales bacterium]
MGKKHGSWLNLDRYLKIHLNVIKKFDWLIGSGEQSYTTNSKIDQKNTQKIELHIKFNTINNYLIKIWKRAIINKINGLQLARTDLFGYNCFKNSDKKKALQYHSQHEDEYKKNLPWHNRPHRHEFIGTTQKIDVYSIDHRPQNEKLNRYTWEEGHVKLHFLGHENWPHVHEFLQEVSELPDAG